jgi:hypothetical protein
LVANCPAGIYGALSGYPEFQTFERRLPIPEFTDEEVSSFTEATKLIKSETHRRAMLQIMRETEPRLEIEEFFQGPLWFNVTDLNGRTFVALRDFMRKL